jgi:hypothetical protein
MNLLVFPGTDSIFAFLASEILSRNEKKACNGRHCFMGSVVFWPVICFILFF